ncbi:hypothetical protein DDD_0300 [Nonlabens dokdonensis DSW-6]|uniref:Uncharacterized protein n=1 Tax=Nonlabens dokdonensis (strain DSM 17205 / KCTC 12402 / DSW-6) TaxID=592029 RepID=L7W5G7_NONDD|nr:hypothetical protein DDD_0300 [Nonlabens dokdonensis DSW-6]
MDIFLNYQQILNNLINKKMTRLFMLVSLSRKRNYKTILSICGSMSLSC